MSIFAPAAIDRDRLAAVYLANRARTGQIFDLIAPAAMYDAPIPLRHPFVFYAGHIPAFSFLTLVRDALGEPSIDRSLEDLFNRGIDPATVDAASRHRRSDWPDMATVERFAAACDARVLDAFAHAALDEHRSPQLVRGEAAFNILEHEAMHQETLLYIVHRLPVGAKSVPATTVRDEPPARRDPVAIPAGVATLGARRDDLVFGWDNEFEEMPIDVPAFGIDVHNVTNGEYAAFVDAGGPPPPFWVEADGAWLLRTLGGTIPLPHSWPVYATNEQARAFARWSGARLMTEPEYHRAAFGTPAGDERRLPWGDARDADPMFGNFDFKRYDPEPAGSYPHGASAFGVHDLVGNGWEWTSTPFGPLNGFHEMPSYPPYSSDFFDGEHFVMKGASPVTSRMLVRRSFRNWYRGGYPYMYATFRRVWD